jgi:hypothetical protein
VVSGSRRVNAVAARPASPVARCDPEAQVSVSGNICLQRDSDTFANQTHGESFKRSTLSMGRARVTPG